MAVGALRSLCIAAIAWQRVLGAATCALMAAADAEDHAVAQELAAALAPLSVAHDDSSVFDAASTPAKTLSLEIVVSGARLPRRKGDTDSAYLKKVSPESELGALTVAAAAVVTLTTSGLCFRGVYR
jgi:hypothetical protein